MLDFVEKLTRDGATQPITREKARRVAAGPKPGRPRAFVFQYRPPTKSFSLNLKFKRSDVEKSEVIEALEGIIAELRAAKE